MSTIVIGLAPGDRGEAASHLAAMIAFLGSRAAGSPDTGKGLGFQIRDGVDKTFIDVGGFLNAIITFLITAAVVYLFVVVPMKKINERREQGKEPEPEGPSEDIALLREIRDSLQRPV